MTWLDFQAGPGQPGWRPALRLQQRGPRRRPEPGADDHRTRRQHLLHPAARAGRARQHVRARRWRRPYIAGAVSPGDRGTPAWPASRPRWRSCSTTRPFRCRRPPRPASPTHPEAVFRQGSGLVNIAGAIGAGVIASPSTIKLGEGKSHTLKISLTNTTAEPLTYTASRVSGVSAAASTSGRQRGGHHHPAVRVRRGRIQGLQQVRQDQARQDGQDQGEAHRAERRARRKGGPALRRLGAVHHHRCRQHRLGAVRRPAR